MQASCKSIVALDTLNWSLDGIHDLHAGKSCWRSSTGSGYLASSMQDYVICSAGKVTRVATSQPTLSYKCCILDRSTPRSERGQLDVSYCSISLDVRPEIVPIFQQSPQILFPVLS